MKRAYEKPVVSFASEGTMEGVFACHTTCAPMPVVDCHQGGPGFGGFGWGGWGFCGPGWGRKPGRQDNGGRCQTVAKTSSGGFYSQHGWHC